MVKLLCVQFLKKIMVNKFYVYDCSLLKTVGMKNQADCIVATKHHQLKEFTTFKSLKLEDISNLRIMLFKGVKINYSWLELILRFLEIRMNEIKKRLKLNYPTYTEMVVFKDCVISFLLEVYYYNKDYRFLNVALKLMDIKFKYISKQSLYNDKLCNYLKMNF